MKKAIFALLVLVCAGALVTAQSGLTLPAGSNTLKSVHLDGTPALGLYYPTASTMYVGGTSGGITFTDTGISGGVQTFPAGSASSVGFGFDSNTGFWSGAGNDVRAAANSTDVATFSNSGVLGLHPNIILGWGASNSYSGWDTYLVRIAADTLAMKRSTNEQEFRVYGSSGTTYLTSGEGGFQGGKTGTFVDEAALDIALVAIAQSGAAVGEFAYGALAATSLEASSGRATFACTNIADTETCDIDIIAESTTAAASTITCVPTIDTDETDAVMFVLTCNEEAGDNGGTVYARFDLLTTNTITWQ